MNSLNNSMIVTMSASGAITKHQGKLAKNLRGIIGDLTNPKCPKSYVCDLINELNLLDYFNEDEVEVVSYVDNKPFIVDGKTTRHRLIITLTINRPITVPWEGTSVYSSIHKLKHRDEILLCDVAIQML